MCKSKACLAPWRPQLFSLSGSGVQPQFSSYGLRTGLTERRARLIQITGCAFSDRLVSM